MKVKWDMLLTATLVVCALTTTALVANREFIDSSTRRVQPSEQKAVFIENWKSQFKRGVQLGPRNARVRFIEFADFECPFCATFHGRMKALRERYPTEIALSYIHYPLPMHRFAIPAARVAECAGEQGRFEEMKDQLFEQQRAFGLKPWTAFAVEAGISDLAAFESCAQSERPVPRIADGQQLAGELGIQGTPTLIINGWKLGRPPSTEELNRMVNAILDGRSPVSRDGKPIQ